ncbi:MAG: cyclophilin-like fold protein [Helicobacter trogontum]|uniref:cyclophilin-like fold protein n=1 Tax=Helicobacter trogontum TaxID=50960 RepID=UPI001EEED206|nr:cyclophilin-like fold protein [Helicobacter trogontum]MCI5787145.1 cyclophilin-like fold protein [Helicobacter trogontum]
MKIKLLFNNQELLINLDKNETSKEFYQSLPLELEFSDFIGKEKIAHLPNELKNNNSNGYEPEIGDLFYYTPWGNIGIFYEKQPFNRDIIFLGKVQGNLDLLRAQKGNFKAKITKE